MTAEARAGRETREAEAARVAAIPPPAPEVQRENAAEANRRLSRRSAEMDRASPAEQERLHRRQASEQVQRNAAERARLESLRGNYR